MYLYLSAAHHTGSTEALELAHRLAIVARGSRDPGRSRASTGISEGRSDGVRRREAPFRIENGRGDGCRRSRQNGNGVPVALVPPDQKKPFESQYIDRSTTIFTPFVTSISAPKPSSCSSVTLLASML